MGVGGLSEPEAVRQVSAVAGPRRRRPVATPVKDFQGVAASLAAVTVAGAALVTGTWWGAAPVPAGAGAALTDAGRFAGLLAGYVALLQVLLRARLPVVERGLGTDSINKTHYLLGGYLIALIIGHAALVTAGSSGNTCSNPAYPTVMSVTAIRIEAIIRTYDHRPSPCLCASLLRPTPPTSRAINWQMKTPLLTLAGGWGAPGMS